MRAHGKMVVTKGSNPMRSIGCWMPGHQKRQKIKIRKESLVNFIRFTYSVTAAWSRDGQRKG